MLIDNALCDRQAQSAAFGAPTDHRVKERVGDTFGDARAVIANLHPGYHAVQRIADGDVAQHPGSQTNNPKIVIDGWTFQCLHRITACISCS